MPLLCSMSEILYFLLKRHLAVKCTYSKSSIKPRGLTSSRNSIGGGLLQIQDEDYTDFLFGYSAIDP